jgi:membrane-bound acyltransferase YfiQ involved in biofilm formation
MGSIPWVFLQLLLVVIVIFFPITVTFFLDEKVKVDLDTVQIDAPAEFQIDDDKKSDDVSKIFGGMSKD